MYFLYSADEATSKITDKELKKHLQVSDGNHTYLMFDSLFL